MKRGNHVRTENSLLRRSLQSLAGGLFHDRQLGSVAAQCGDRRRSGLAVVVLPFFALQIGVVAAIAWSPPLTMWLPKPLGYQ